MSWSLGEISALVVKAARGAGRSWGEAEEAGWAVRWLSRSGIDGAGALACLLSAEEVDDTCALRAGLCAADAEGQAWPDPERPLRAPVLALPFLARGLHEGQGALLDLAGTRVQLARSGALVHRALPQNAGIRWIAAIPTPALPRHPRLPDPAPGTLKLLTGFAGHTYAPATAQSRLSGAGAGLSDND